MSNAVHRCHSKKVANIDDKVAVQNIIDQLKQKLRSKDMAKKAASIIAEMINEIDNNNRLKQSKK